MGQLSATPTVSDTNDVAADERGITLIEVLVYALLLSFVLAIAGGMLISAVKVSQTVVSMTENSTSGQLVSRSVVTGIRNSSDFQLSNPTGDDQLLIARRATAGTAVDWMCVAWYYSAADGTVWSTSSSTEIPLPATSADVSTWTLLTSDVLPATGTTVFSALNDRLSISILGLDGAHRPIDITSSATSRAGASGSLTCY
jgi:hypothetical protein